MVCFFSDVIGLLSVVIKRKEVTKNGSPLNMISFELDDLSGNKFRCTLWENFAVEMCSVIDKSCNEFVIFVIQFAKMKSWRAFFGSKGQIVLNVASSGIAAELLPGGRTAHSRFAIPIDINEDSTYNIKKGTPLVELLSKTKLIIWGEAPMSHKFCFESLDKSLRDVLKDDNNDVSKNPFGGIIIVLGGDFRQILPVVPYGGRQEIVHATINSSYLDFSDWLLKVGDGEIGDDVDGESIIEIPEEMLIEDDVNGLAQLVDFLTNLWDDEFHNVVQMNYATSAPPDSHEDANASLPGHMKVEL
ncbi:hypothetical protein SLEP1_g58565 [Rubroshorea leprosula]|uniref:ATP-dependent DNA helicase n=1 Tax=Rubroshorea leprosula TaxID=152421 RepID=A0AAV5MTS9_9ROSI|nr:hypothetical protein SLEP1_g58565 [Rubroshorea leprosula]